MKKFFLFALGLIALCTFFTSCNEEDYLKTVIGEDVRPFDYERLQEAGKGWIVESSGDSICGHVATLEHPEETVTPENLGRATYSPMGDVREEVIDGILYIHRDFLGSDGNVLHVKSWAPETLAEKAGILGYFDRYDILADPVELVSITENRATLKAVASMVFYRDSKEVGRVSVKPNYNHVTVKPDEPEPLTVVVDTMYFYEGPEGFLKIHAARTNSSRTIYEVFIDQQLPLYGDGRFYGTDVWHAAAPARFDASVGNNGLLITIEPQPDRSYTGKVEDEYITSAQSYNCCRISTAFVNDGDGTATTECVIDYWTKEYQFHDPVTGWSMKTHPIELTHKVTRNELTQVDGTRNDRYGKPHHEIATLATEVTSTLILNGKEEDVNQSSGISHISEWREK